MKQAVQAPDFSVPGFVFQLRDIAASHGNILGVEQGDRLAQGLGLQEDPQGVGIHGIFADQWRDHGALVRHYLQQRLRFELAQGLAHRHAADAKQGGQFLLTQGHARRQATIEDGTAQPLFNHTARQVGRNLLATAQNVAQKFGFFGHAVSA
ncbi:hypothetical protein D9M71_606770 [compost metagenome]